MKAYYIISAVIFFSFNTAFTQTDIQKTIDNYISFSVAKKNTSQQLKQILTFEGTNTLNALSRYYSDSILQNRIEAYNLLNIIGTKAKHRDVRVATVKQLISGIQDRDVGVAGMNMNYLTQYKKDDFDKEARQELFGILTKQVPNYHLLIKLVGFTGDVPQKEALRKMLQEKKFPNNKARLAMHLALARLGDEVEVEFLLNKIKAVPVNDDLIYEVVPDLVYTSQKKVYDYLLDIIMLDDKNCSSGNPDSSGKILCGYKVIEYIAGHIKDFPVETDNAGEVKAMDYSVMLTKIRDWIKLNKEDYIILTNTY